MKRTGLLLLALVGCEPSRISLPEVPTPIDEPMLSTAHDPGSCGTLHGFVRWEGEPPACEPVLRAIGPIATESIPNPNALKLNSDRGIIGAVVILFGIDPTKARPWTHEVVRVELNSNGITILQGSRSGRVGFVRRGDPVRFAAATDRVYGFRARQDDFFANILLPGASYERRMVRPGRVTLTSASGQFWASADLFVLDHPYATVTDAAGCFELTEIPAGAYELIVWHPNWIVTANEVDPETAMLVRQLYAAPYESRVNVTISAGRSSSENLTLKR